MAETIAKTYELLSRRSGVVSAFVPIVFGLEDRGTGASRILMQKPFIDSLSTFYEYRASVVFGEHGSCRNCILLANLIVGVAEGVAYFDELIQSNAESAEVFLEEAESLLSVLLA